MMTARALRTWRLVAIICGVLFTMGCGRTELGAPFEDDEPEPFVRPDLGVGGEDNGPDDLGPISDMPGMDIPDDQPDLPDPVDMPDDLEDMPPDLPPSPTCEDRRQNGDESDIDCGGPRCEPCAQGLQCVDNSDCQSDRCEEGICRPPLLDLGDACSANEDCTSRLCTDLNDGRSICSQPCMGSCPTQGLACFDGLCVPSNYCEADDGLGLGPGCMGSPCERCDTNATCNIADGMATCSCNQGYAGDGFSCRDVNECGDSALNNCDQDATCTNTQGGFTCECNTGYTGNGFVCDDINECADPMLNDCDTNATCTNTVASFTCSCNAGYRGNGQTCIDIDECLAGTDNCSPNATCTNTDGSFTCACDMGYTGDGVMCSDVNECNDPNACPGNQPCFNTPGGFNCGCQPGFEPDAAGTCVDIDECADPMLNTCDANATCTNTPGSFTCQCNTGFVGNGQTCSPVMSPLGDTCANPFVVPGDAYSAVGDTSSMNANDDYSLPRNTCGSFSEIGDVNNDQVYEFSPSQTGTYDISVDAPQFTAGVYIVENCSDIRNTCLASDRFTPDLSTTLTAGTTYYIIVDGASTFRSDGSYDITIDLNECSSSSTNNCGQRATCNNILGSFVCTCPNGYQLNANNDCVDVDECADGLDDCDAQATCTNTTGSFTCSCNMGLSGDGVTCWDPAISGESCTNPFVIPSISVGSPYIVSGNTANAFNDYSYSSNSCPGERFGSGDGSPDEVYEFTPAMTGNYRFEVSSSFNTTLYIVTDCSSIDTSCIGADREFSRNPNINANLTAGTTYYIVIDGGSSFSSQQGAYTLSGVAF